MVFHLLQHDSILLRLIGRRSSANRRNSTSISFLGHGWGGSSSMSDHKSGFQEDLWLTKVSPEAWFQGGVGCNKAGLQDEWVPRWVEGPQHTCETTMSPDSGRESVTGCRKWLQWSWEGLSYCLLVFLWRIWSNTKLISHDWTLILRLSLVCH